MPLDPAAIPTSVDDYQAQKIGSLEYRVSALERMGGRIGSNALNGDLVVRDGTLTGSSLAVGSVQADRITTGTLAAAVVTLGSGGRLETAASGARVVFDSTGIYSQNVSAVELFRLSATDGSFTIKTGNSGARVLLDTSCLKSYNSSGVLNLQIDATDGVLRAGGVSPNARVELDKDGIRAYNTSNVQKLRFDVLSGNLTIAGALTAESSSAIPVTYVTSGNVVAGTIITLPASGGYFQTSPSNPRMQWDNAGIRAYDNTGALMLDLRSSDGSFYTYSTSTIIQGATIRTAVNTSARVQMVGGATNALEVYDSTPTKIVSLDGTNGLDLLASTSSAFSSDVARAVTWKSGSTVVGRMKTTRYNPGTGYNVVYNHISAIPTVSADNPAVILAARNVADTLDVASVQVSRGTTGSSAEVLVQAAAESGITALLDVRAPTTTTASIVAQAGTPSRTVINESGNSDFARTPLGNAMVMGARVHGLPAGPPQILGAAPAGGITAVNRTGVGTYTLTHAATPSGLSYGAVTPQGAFGATQANFSPLTSTTCAITLTNSAGAAVDDLFTIVIMG